MDPAHRDRIAFLRVASGQFQRGMRLKVVRSGKELRPNTVVSFMSQRRELLDTAFAGDIIGIPNHGVLQLGDTLTEGEALQFTGLPFFAPEMFRSVEVADPLRSKQLRAGLTQLGEEGAIQVFRPLAGSLLLLGAVGQLQFEVVAHRLEHEYGVKARITASHFNLARWVSSDDANELKKFMDANQHRVALDAVDAPTLLVDHSATLRAVEQQWPKIKFHALREHACDERAPAEHRRPDLGGRQQFTGADARRAAGAVGAAPTGTHHGSDQQPQRCARPDAGACSRPGLRGA
jgi:peptide chain release factor 3